MGSSNRSKKRHSKKDKKRTSKKDVPRSKKGSSSRSKRHRRGEKSSASSLVDYVNENLNSGYQVKTEVADIPIPEIPLPADDSSLVTLVGKKWRSKGQLPTVVARQFNGFKDDEAVLALVPGAVKQLVDFEVSFLNTVFHFRFSL